MLKTNSALTEPDLLAGNPRGLLRAAALKSLIPAKAGRRSGIRRAQNEVLYENRRKIQKKQARHLPSLLPV